MLGPIPDLKPESWGLTRDLGFHLYVTVGKLLYLPVLHLQSPQRVHVTSFPWDTPPISSLTV